MRVRRIDAVHLRHRDAGRPTIIEQVPAADVDAAVLAWSRISEARVELDDDTFDVSRPSLIDGCVSAWGYSLVGRDDRFILTHIVATAVVEPERT